MTDRAPPPPPEPRPRDDGGWAPSWLAVPMFVLTGAIILAAFVGFVVRQGW